MIQSNSNDSGDSKEEKLSQKDWLLLVMLSLLTIIFLSAATEFAARKIFNDTISDAAHPVKSARCIIFDDLETGPRAIPNCDSWDKNYEGPFVEYRFNRCGHRAGMECGPKPADTYRIVMAGTSVAMGASVPFEKTFAVQLPIALSQQTGHKVQLYNEAVTWEFLNSNALRFDDNDPMAKPDMVLWVITPADIRGLVDHQSSGHTDLNAELRYLNSLSLSQKILLRFKAAFASRPLDAALSQVFDRTRTALMLRHFLYQSQSEFLNSYLIGDEEETGFLRTEMSEVWKEKLRRFDSEYAAVEARAKAAGVPLVAVLIPYRAQAAMISMGEWPAGYDPYKLGNELRSIVERHGGTYIDILPDFRTLPNSEQYYYPVDGHPNTQGNLVLSRLLEKELTSGAIPALKVTRQQQPAREQSR